MNANELADELDTMLKAIGLTDNRVPTMLRQQQAEIEALKNENKRLTEFCEAYFVDETTDESFDRTASHMAGEYVSYPADLTDEEIESIFQKETGFTLDCDAKVDEVAMLDFARAILRKAQEK